MKDIKKELGILLVVSFIINFSYIYITDTNHPISVLLTF